jgi:hypothetical protein
MGGGGGVAGSQPMSTAVHMEPKYTLEIYNSIFNLWEEGRRYRQPCIQQSSGLIFTDDVNVFPPPRIFAFMVGCIECSQS